jgi:hypothetical protein
VAEAAPEPEQADPADAPEPEADATPEADPEAPEFLHGNARTRLRDGSEVTIGELKKAYDEAKEYRVKQAEFDAKRQEFEAKQTQIAQQEQYFQQTIQQAKQVLQANFPPKPDYSALERGEIDVITYTEQKARWDAAAEKWQSLSRAEQVAKQKAEEDSKAETQKRIADETQRFLDRSPDMKTREAQKAFADDVLKIGQDHYGFTPQDLAQKMDHRDLLVLKDAIAWRKLQADKSKALEKAKDAPPVQVQSPSRRVSAPERAAQNVSEKLAAARRSGGLSMADALSLINDI